MKKILIVSPTPSHPHDAGNKVRVYSIISNLKAMGWDVYFLHVRFEKGDRRAMRECWGDRFITIPYEPRFHFRRILRAKVLETGLYKNFSIKHDIDEWYPANLDECIKKLSQKIKFDVVIVEYVFFSKALENFGKKVLKVIDTHDCFTNRHKMFLKRGEKPTFFYTSLKQEAKGLRRADVTIAIQKNENQFFSKLTNKKVITVGHIVPVEKYKLKEQNNYNILFVGSANKLNQYGIKYFYTKIFPLIRKEIPKAQLILAGKICDVMHDIKKCKKLGRIENIKAAYDMADVVINPLLYGTGLKIKTIEALSFNKPLVTTSVGADGLESASSRAFLVADDPQQFADRVIELLKSDSKREALAQSANEFMNEYNNLHLNTLKRLLNKRITEIR